MTEKDSTNNKGYKETKKRHSKLIHRIIAHELIYLKNKEDYPLPYSQYQVHHIDGNKTNNDPSNLKLVTKEEHEKIHKEQGDYVKCVEDDDEISDIVICGFCGNDVDVKVKKCENCGATLLKRYIIS